MKSLQKIIYSFVFLTFFLLGFSPICSSQNGFSFPESQEKDKIDFKLVNNLVVIPVTVNGTNLSFVLDTGVNATIVFSLTNRDSLDIKNAVPVKIRGLGEGASINGLKSENNTIKIGKATDSNHTLYFIFDPSLNFSTRMGIPIHGIIGYDFFKSFIVKTNYNSETLRFYSPNSYKQKACRRCETFDLKFFQKKPYMDVVWKRHSQKDTLTLLMDSGSSDAVWLFNPEGVLKEDPKNYFEDYLGLGLSGNIYGKRSRVEEINIGRYSLNNVNVSIPDANSIADAQINEARDGSLGGGLLKRFTTIIDYSNKKLMLRPNRFFSDPFHYDMSGLTIQHSGLTLIKDRLYESKGNLVNEDSGSVIGINLNPSYTFNLQPKYVVAEIRENSPADLAGFKIGDEIISVNSKRAQRYELYELIQLFSSREGRRIVFEIGRNGVKLKKKIILEDML